MSELQLALARIKGLEAENAALREALLAKPDRGAPLEIVPPRPQWATGLFHTEWKLLSALIEAEGATVTNDALLNRVCREDGDPKTIKTHVCNIRRKLGEDIILTAFREGYRFNAAARALAA